ncbi:MAG: SH3 domain-containing protein [Patescibacteria group bacterium]|nr:SH3 domain-containing protein [Patescibacteria group bacterium]
MALAQNLNKHKIVRPKKPRNSNKVKKYLLIIAVILAICIGAYGIVNLTRIAPKEEDKKELVLETGDRPLPEVIKIWTTAEGGLNLRSEPSTDSEVLTTIPEGTELVAEELSDDWYKVTYKGKTGWVHKDFVRTFSDETDAASTTEGWEKYANTKYSYSTVRPEDWVERDYGANSAANLASYVAFGAQLPDTLDPAVLPPVVVKVTTDSKAEVEKLYAKKTDADASDVKVSGIAGKKYTYTASSGVQMTAYVVATSKYTYILEESGGYSTELTKMAESFKVS